MKNADFFLILKFAQYLVFHVAFDTISVLFFIMKKPLYIICIIKKHRKKKNTADLSTVLTNYIFFARSRAVSILGQKLSLPTAL